MYKVELYEIIGRNLDQAYLWLYFTEATHHHRFTKTRLDFLNRHGIAYHVEFEIARWSRTKETATWYACIEDPVQAVHFKLSLDTLT